MCVAMLVLDDAVLPYHASPEAAVTLGETSIPHPKEVALISGTGDFTMGRKASIFMPTRHQMQSGTYNTRHWEIRFDSPRTWQNPLMGWTSTADPLHGMLLKFDKKEEAVHFAEKQGTCGGRCSAAFAAAWRLTHTYGHRLGG